MTILIKDTFTDVDGTLLINHISDIGGSWASTGSGKISGNKVVAGAITGSPAAVTHTKQASVFNSYAQGRPYTGADGMAFYLHINYGGSWSDELYVVSGGQFRLNGVDIPSIPFVDGGLYKIKRIDDIVYAYLDGVLKASQPARGTQRKFYIEVHTGYEAPVYFDDYEAGEEVPVLYSDHLPLMGVH